MSNTNTTKKRKPEEDPSVGKKKTYEELEEELLLVKRKLAKAEELVASLKAQAGSSNQHGDLDDDDDDDGISMEDPENPWNIKFKELRAYRIINGDCKVSEKGPQAKLGKWIFVQKGAYKNLKQGKKGKQLSDDKILKLESIGIHWGKSFPAPVPWEERLDELQKYKAAMRCDPPVNPKDPSPLAKWVSFQRSEYRRFKKGRDSLLTMEQIGQLNDIGFKWKGPRLT
jgi:Helicase associated domain